MNEPAEKNNGTRERPNSFTIASFVLAISPLVILLAGYLICLILSGGRTSDNDAGAIWWVFVVLVMILVPVTLISDIVSAGLGIMGIKRQKGRKTLFSFMGIIIVGLEILTVSILFLL